MRFFALWFCGAHAVLPSASLRRSLGTLRSLRLRSTLLGFDGVLVPAPQTKTGWAAKHLPSVRTGAPAKDKKARIADRVTWIGAGVNVALTALKLGAGVAGHSSAMISDAVHSGSDLLSDFVTLITMRLSRVPADDDHPYGHGRFETLGALIVGVMLLTAATGLAGHAISALGLGGAADAVVEVPGTIAAVAAAVSVVSKELLYRATARVGYKVRSPVLIANAWHHRSDAASSVVALVGIAAARWGGFAAADALAAGAVAVMLGATGLSVATEALAELVDSVEVVELADVRARLEAVEGILSVASIRGRLVGGALSVDADVVALHSELSSSACARLAAVARMALLTTEEDEHEHEEEGEDLMEASRSHSHGHGHAGAGGRSIVSATVRVVPNSKPCPVLAAMPSEDLLEHKVATILESVPGCEFDRLEVHYTEGPCVDVFLRPTDLNLSVRDLAARSDEIHKSLQERLRAATVSKVYWSTHEVIADAQKAEDARAQADALTQTTR